MTTDREWIQRQIDLAQAVRVANHPEKTLGIPQLMIGGEVLVGFDSQRAVAQFFADAAGLRPQSVRREVEIEVVSPPPNVEATGPPEWATTAPVPAPSADQLPTTIPLVMHAAPLRREKVQMVMVNVVGTDAERVVASVPPLLAEQGVYVETSPRTASGKVPVRLHFPKGFVAPEVAQSIVIDVPDGKRSSTLVAVERAKAPAD